MFRRILIANRGEVAARVLRTCKRMGIEVVAVTSQADAGLGWLKDADQVVCIGPAKSAGSYLSQENILEAAKQTGATAIHPGWGFLAENADFSARCAAVGITFIGPGPRVMRSMGDKIQARATMDALGMPLIPGSQGQVCDLRAAASEAERIGYPVLLKATAGGGGRGMRRVFEPAGLQEGFESASNESLAAFGNGALYMEKLIVGGRHIEFQVVVDRFGNAIHLGERECSIQRRHQKLIEESPSPALTQAEREEMGALVAAIAARAGYRNAGTIEMLRDATTGELYFMEMNTRLQVEHTISEEVTGVDLVELQLKIAANHAIEPIPPKMTGHAIEARINAEDVEQDFRPCPGTITRLVWPQGEGIRVDSHLHEGDEISPHYDSMIAKIIAHGSDRSQAISRLKQALKDLVVEGVKTTTPLHIRVLENEEFLSGRYDTTTLTRMLEA